ncbi:Guanine nucleotide-binding protein subunit alpha [Zancudomyces culisetae]|uniref:Guanine nucleotide-binding protein subunit alpha n=1 Tax=Zancudomyces culisetae TaxID=1213189 RepID=A0A1R1PPE6_ZANCU|nr:Guanine nucleotide-binding protein subunit alpha [Zancudomyces culisetae]|eukprot:OMH82773.1 Guanine nucleotide-binding protein subunit alpha [Zancudomyces culisetae]
MSKLDLDSILSVEVTSELVKSMELLWNEKNIDKVLLNDKGVAVMDSADYFFQNARRISLPGYIPNIDDVLRARLKTTGITEIDFMMNNRIIRMFDVGGQRSERKKWIHCFEGVTSVIFCVSLSDYDQSLLEETSHRNVTSKRAEGQWHPVKLAKTTQLRE